MNHDEKQTMQTFGSLSAALVLALATFLGGCPAKETPLGESRTVEACTETDCLCAFTSECPGAMGCVNGVCSMDVPDTSDVAPDASPDVTTDTPGDQGDAGDLGPDGGDVKTDTPGGTGAFCEENLDCDSGWCVDSTQGGYCAPLCSAGCPDEWVCKQIIQLGDPVDICVRDETTICLPCEIDAHCGGSGADKCLDIGGGRFCSRDCSSESCPVGYECQTVTDGAGNDVQQCIPDNGTCDCVPSSEGHVKGCTVDNDFGTCFGESTCDPALGWVQCTADTPAEETCNGLDDDCDGSTDEGQSPESCDKTNEFGTCPGERTCQGPAGWVCSAKEPTAELCNGLDDDCDGETDEDFIDEDGLFFTNDNCGNCGLSCAEKFDNAAETECDVSSGTPTCKILGCSDGYFLFNEVTCLSENATLCNQCNSDADCFGDLSRCVQISPTDPRTFCGRDCSGASGFSTTCPASYECTDLGGGDMQCLPVTGSCDCTEANSGQVKACSLQNASGTCFGQETCDPTQGWIDCSAPVPADETCNGADDDCDGLVDEDQAVGDPCQVDNSFGTCDGTTYCGGSAGIVCSAKTPAEEVCDGLDNDCDGETDEGFATQVGGGLKYGLSVEHCGGCNYACPPVANGTVTCDATPQQPVCAVESCTEGYYPYQGITCLPLPTANQCAACLTDADCQGPGDVCVDEGTEGDYCGRDCDAGSIYSTTANPCTGTAGEQGCCPAGNTCEDVGGAMLCRPTSGTCSCTQDGAVDACEVTNGFGTCLGTRTCDTTSGWSACTAGTPAAEVCDGADNDCDGAVDGIDDSLDYSTTPDGVQACETGPACQGQWVCSGGGWECSAKPSLPEECNAVDDDCDGDTDEDFITGGLYLDAANCGACGLDCAQLIPHSATVACQDQGGVPTCVATDCDTGYVPFAGGTVCLALPDNLCQACNTDSDCLVGSSACVTSGPEKFCGRSCGSGSPYGTSCPSGYACQDVGGGDMQCVPTAGTCVCGSGTVGLQRACPVGACTGLQTCQDQGGGSFGFTTCSAEGVIPEVCDGADNDCDGQTDEGAVDGSGNYTLDENCGQCGNNCLLRWTEAVHHAVGACSGGGDPECVIATCTTEVQGGTTYEWVDTNNLSPDGCECRRVQGNTGTDLPDVDFGGAFPAIDADYEDENCDGVDGVVGDALFVSAANPTAGNGTIGNPYQTIGAAVSAFGASGKDYILVAAGIYEENVVLSAGVELHGGYAPDFQSRNIATFTTTIRGQAPGGTPGAVRGINLTSGTTVVSGFTIEGYDVTTPGTPDATTSYAVYLRNCDDSVQILNNRIHGGLGGPGQGGGNGTNGFGATSSGGSALNGGNGQDSVGSGFNCPVTGSCDGGDTRDGGSGGTNSQCPSANGVDGADATCPDYNQPSYSPPVPSKDGYPGYSWTRDSGTNSDCGSHLTEAGFPTDIKKMDGGNGAPGANGSSGQQGNGCSDADGSFSGGLWQGGSAGGGAGGGHGARGGIGGSSGGVDTADSGEMPSGVGAAGGTKRWRMGAGGGGAGAGGCGGTGGAGGTTGGASIAVFVAYTSTSGISNPPEVRANRITRGVGGNGGVGGYGGAGGVGGNGGTGGDSNGFWVDFRAGDGGRGGYGGVGGGGGGGCGGASFGVATFGHPAGWTLTYGADNVFTLPDAAGTGGVGGVGGPSGTPNGSSTGANGASANVHAVAN